jgi:DNA polymerase I-like protein with 3'-5' exonuclease and polymerase domains
LRPLDLNPGVYLREDYLVLDVETTNKDYGHARDRRNRMVLASWRGGPVHQEGRAVHSHFGNEYEQCELLEAINKSSFVVAHNAKFELGWLIRCGIDPRKIIVWCTQIAEFVIAGNRRFDEGLSLEAIAKRYKVHRTKLQYVSELIENGVCPSEIPRSELQPYCERDVGVCEEVFLLQRKRIFSSGLANVTYGRCLQTPMLADIEQRGIKLDEQRVNEASKETGAEYISAQQALEEAYGTINWDSPKQKRELIYDKLHFQEATDYRGRVIRTKSGERSTASDTMAALKASTPEQRKFLKLYRRIEGLSKENQYLTSMLGCLREDGGILHANLNQTVAKNHRLSSTGGKWGLQFQNQPRRFKHLYCPRERGWVIVDGDCPQLEFRGAADLANDAVAKGDILARTDVHLQTGSVTGFDRQAAKPHTFKPLYGGSSGPPRLVAYYNFFREKYKGIYDTQMSWVYHVLEHKELRTASGLIFYWPDTERLRSGYITNTTEIFNYPVSSFATADISQLSLVLTWHHLGDMDSFVINTVHDSGVLEVCEEELDKVNKIMVNCYTNKIYDTLDSLYGYKFTTPLGVAIKNGPNWGEGEEAKYESERFEFST